MPEQATVAHAEGEVDPDGEMLPANPCDGRAGAPALRQPVASQGGPVNLTLVMLLLRLAIALVEAASRVWPGGPRPPAEAGDIFKPCDDTSRKS